LKYIDGANLWEKALTGPFSYTPSTPSTPNSREKVLSNHFSDTPQMLSHPFQKLMHFAPSVYFKDPNQELVRTRLFSSTDPFYYFSLQ